MSRRNQEAPTLRRLGRFEELEAYRGIAALLIVVYHAYQYARDDAAQYVYDGTWLHVIFRNLEASVSWFFVLSGFLVCLPFVRAAVDQRPLPPVGGFLVRRAIRILPAYYVAILAVWTWRYTGGTDQWIDLLQHLTFTHIFDRTHFFWTIGPAWSLGVEVLFYGWVAVCAPLVYRMCSRFASRPTRIAVLAAMCAALIGGSLAYKWWAFSIARVPESDWPVYFGLIAKLDTLMLGVLLAVIVAAAHDRVLIGPWMAHLLRLTGLVLIAVTYLTRFASPALDLYFHTLNGLAFALVLLSTIVSPRGSAWERMMAWPPLHFLGLISYSVYLWHEPLLIELGARNLLIHHAPQAFPGNTVVLVLLSIAVGTVSYYGLESPTMELRHLFAREGKFVQAYNTSAHR